jgi:hypothetical protein
MLRHEQDRFLDDMTKQQLETELGAKIMTIPDGAALAAALMS